MILSKFNLFFLISALLVWIIVNTGSESLIYAYTALIFFYTIFNTRLGLAAWCIVAPLSSIIGDFTVIIFPMAFLFPYALKLLKGKEPFFNSTYLKYSSIQLLIAFISSILTAYTEYIHVLVLILIVLFMGNVLYQQLKKESEYIFIIGNAFIFSALIALSFSLQQSDDIIRRLSLEESVRLLSNIVSFGILFLVTTYFFIPKPKRNYEAISQYKLMYLLKFVLLPVLVFGLVSTMSRGSLFSLVVATLVLIILSNYKVLKKMKLGALIKLFIGLSFIIFLISYFNNYLINLFGISIEDFGLRLEGIEIEGGVGVRQDIWKAGISGLDGWNVLYGNGVSSFRMLAKQNGYDYYSHSVFVDIFVTTGVIGLIVLFFLFKQLIIQIFKYKSILSVTFLIFLTLNFATHGSMGADLFWYSLAISFGLIKMNVIDNKIVNR